MHFTGNMSKTLQHEEGRYYSDKPLKVCLDNGGHFRDKRVNEQLVALGWKVLRYWGCEIQNDLARVLSDIERHLE